ncbi:MAG: hypothetical protein EOP24_00820 [Hyphomicrobiales bacterium]|nr:MAG: hypothetical protein EOP24_00820 [Hyphomicrobiales bacterium]
MSVNPATASTSPSIWQELESWSVGFWPWQRLLLANAVRFGAIPSAVIEQAYTLFLAENDLGEAPNPAPLIPASITGRDISGAGRSRLNRVHSPSGVNRLPVTAELTFADGLTVIYGANGVGKSGFARILSNACFSRQQHTIFPDVYDENAALTPTASIELIDDAGATTTFTFDGAVEHAALKRGFVVFDSAVAKRHLTDSGPLGFNPTGFDIFPEMARAYATMASMLAADVQKRSRANTFSNAFIGPETTASRAASTLGRTTDLDALRALAAFGVDQVARIEVLQTQADQLRAKSPAAEIKRLSEARPLILTLNERLAAARAALSEEYLDADMRLRQALVTAATSFARVGADQFSSPAIAGVGTPQWERMVAGSQELARQQHLHYPGEGDICLLCHQELDESARELYAGYSAFVSGEARATLLAAQARVQAREKALRELQLPVVENGSIARSFLAQSHPAVLTALDEAISKLEALRESAVKALIGDGERPAALALEDFDDTVDGIIILIDSDLQRLRQSDVPSTIAAIDRERVELRHRQVLSKSLDAIVGFVRDQKWMALAEGVRSQLSPRHLTDKQQELFASVIAKNYRVDLATECEALNCDVPIELHTQGRQGQTIRSLLVRDRSPDDILSEGEQRAVALADFLTEVGLNPDNIGIILDDPVTSLDIERKDRIAARLVKEAASRQVILFTHDMVFFVMLVEAAGKAGLKLTTHWMQRSGDKMPGLVSANDSPTTTMQYRKTTFAEAALAAAKTSAGSVQEELVRKGAGQLRRTIEEIVPHLLFKDVVRRWTDRIVVTALKKVSWDNAVADEAVEIFEACSAIMEGHSHTEGGTGAPPTYDDLEKLIERTKELIRSARAERK